MLNWYTKCATKISPTLLNHHQQPEPLRQGRMIHAFMFFTPNSDPTIWMSQQKSRLILVILCELYPTCPVLSWQERHPVWSSAAEAHLLQGSTCCVFRDGILHILVVTSGYLSYCCLSIISNQSAILLWPLTSTRHFHPHNCRSLDIFSFSDHSL